MIEYSRLSALIVESSLMMRNIITEMLHQYGIRQIVKVANAEEAEKVAGSQSFDFIILDFFLGSMDGGDFARQLRRNESSPNRRVPILLITAQPDHDKVLKSRDCGVNEILAKPISADGLLVRLNAMMEKSRPFIISRNYTGPCRRRRDLVPLNGKERRRDALVLDQVPAPQIAKTGSDRNVFEI